MCEIYILRHGRTAMDVLKRSDGWLDLPLSDKGRMGLIEAQQYLKLEKLGCIYAPPLRRTMETAHIVQSGMIKEPDVKEAKEAITWDLGVLMGTPKVDSKPKVEDLLEHPDKKPMGGESYNAFKKRYMSWFRKVVTESEKGGKPILIVCSGSNARLLGSVLFNDPDKIDLDEGGLAVLRREGDSQWHEEIIFGDENESPYIS